MDVRHVDAPDEERDEGTPVDLPSFELPRGHLSVAIAGALKEMILAGQLRPGDKLPNEKALCEHFGVSRISIREAVQMLRALGMVEPIRGRGTFVREPDWSGGFLRDLAYFAFDSAGSVVDLFEVRNLLECRAAQRSALQGPVSKRPELLDLVEEMKELIDAPELDTVRYGELDARFHLRIAELSGNLVLAELMNRVMQILEAVRVRSLSVPGQARRSWSQHAQIAEAIARGEPELAVARVVEHLETTKAAIIAGERVQQYQRP